MKTLTLTLNCSQFKTDNWCHNRILPIKCPITRVSHDAQSFHSMALFYLILTFTFNKYKVNTDLVPSSSLWKNFGKVRVCSCFSPVSVTDKGNGVILTFGLTSICPVTLRRFFTFCFTTFVESFRLPWLSIALRAFDCLVALTPRCGTDSRVVKVR